LRHNGIHQYVVRFGLCVPYVVTLIWMTTLSQPILTLIR
jgi:hypothetical protein